MQKYPVLTIATPEVPEPNTLWGHVRSNGITLLVLRMITFVISALGGAVIAGRLFHVMTRLAARALAFVY